MCTNTHEVRYETLNFTPETGSLKTLEHLFIKTSRIEGKIAMFGYSV